MIIAIDGPSGAGKSTMAKLLAKELEITYLDTGAIYRSLGLLAFRQGLNEKNIDEILPILENFQLKMDYFQGETKVTLFGEDISSAIRENHISQIASDISKHKEVRIKLVDMQRQIAKGKSMILDGRDIGTFVFPNADFKFYLDADPKIRAKRRVKELLSRGQSANYEQVLQEIIFRDENDKKRDFAPLKQADDAILIDTSNLSIPEVVEKMKNIIKNSH